MSLISAVVLPCGARVDPEPFLLDTENYEQIQSIVGGLFDAVRVQVGDREHETVLVGYVNDEGLLRGMEPNYLASALFQRELVGPCLVVGGLSPDGEYDGDSYDVPEWCYGHLTDSLVRSVAEAYNQSLNLQFAFENCVEEMFCTAEERDALKERMREVAGSPDDEIDNILTSEDRELLEVLLKWAEVEAYRAKKIVALAKGDNDLLERFLNALEDSSDDE